MINRLLLADLTSPSVSSERYRVRASTATSTLGRNLDHRECSGRTYNLSLLGIGHYSIDVNNSSTCTPHCCDSRDPAKPTRTKESSVDINCGAPKTFGHDRHHGPAHGSVKHRERNSSMEHSVRIEMAFICSQRCSCDAITFFDREAQHLLQREGEEIIHNYDRSDPHLLAVSQSFGRQLGFGGQVSPQSIHGIWHLRRITTIRHQLRPTG